MRGCRGYTHVLGATCLARDRHNCNAAIILIVIILFLIYDLIDFNTFKTFTLRFIYETHDNYFIIIKLRF
jgi:hypothetical protein